MNDISAFVQMSQQLGNNLFYIQGPGGNTSVKTDTQTMTIKASGSVLKSVTKTSGYSTVCSTQVLNCLHILNMDNDTFSKSMNACVVATNNRPSIETALHAILPKKYVLHTHSVWVNLLTCSQQGKNIAHALFPESIWLPYETPGLDLCISLQKSVKNMPDVQIIFLQNHGILVCADTADTAINIHEYVNTTIQNHLNIFPKSQYLDIPIMPIKHIRNTIIFPDQVVFSTDTLCKTTAAQETLWAYSFLIKIIQDIGLSINPLPDYHASILLNMESEKYRQKIAT